MIDEQASLCLQNASYRKHNRTKGELIQKFELMLADSVEIAKQSGPNEIGFAELAAYGYVVDDDSQ